MTAEILKFPHNDKDIIFSLMETAKLLVKISPEQWISIQRDVIDLLIMGRNRSALSARVVFKAFKTVLLLELESLG